MSNRWLVLLAGCVIQTILGGIYAWSAFIPYLHRDYGVGVGPCGFIFGTTILTFTLAMILAGRVLVKKGPRVTGCISAALFALGYLSASFSSGSFWFLLFSLGLMVGAGIGFGYVCPLSVGMKWFPDKKGLVTGVAVAGFGAGAILLSSCAEYFLIHGADVLLFFRWFGGVAGVTLFGSAWLLSDPPVKEARGSAPHDLSVIFSGPFFVPVIGLFAGTLTGLFIVGNLTFIVLGEGFTETQATLSVSVFALSNGVGRIVWGKLYDQFSYKCIPLSLVGFACAAGALLVPFSVWFMVVVVALVGFCFGANFVLYASAISRFFGTASFPRLYPICFMAYGVAGVIGPGLGGFIADRTGSYHVPVYICISIVLLAGVFTYLKLPVFDRKLGK